MGVFAKTCVHFKAVDAVRVILGFFGAFAGSLCAVILLRRLRSVFIFITLVLVHIVFKLLYLIELPKNILQLVIYSSRRS